VRFPNETYQMNQTASRWFLGRFFSPMALALFLCLAGCGHATRTASQADSPGAIPRSTSITGDYDRDDDYPNKPTSDGDDDDSKPTDRDQDSDNPGNSYFDSDDRSLRDFGRVAPPADRRAITRLVKRYFAAAAAHDGAAACAMILPALAKTAPETLGRPPGPSYARGTTCAAVISRIFIHYHRQLAAHLPTLEVSDVRVRGDSCVVVMAFKSLPGREIRLVRERRVWRMAAWLDTELP